MKRVSSSVESDSQQPPGLQPTRLLCPWDSPGKNTGVGYLFLLQGIFPTQGSNSDLLHGRQILYHLSHMGGVQCNPCQNSNGIFNNNKNLKFTGNHRRPQIPTSILKEKSKAGATTSSDEHYSKSKDSGNTNSWDDKPKRLFNAEETTE